MRKVLVVDDEWAIAEVLVDLLSDENYHVLSAHNGREALKVLSSEPGVELVLLDYMMPIMNGAAALAEIRARPETASLPVILMTSLPEHSVDVGRTQYSAFLRKPFLIDEVIKAVRTALS